MTTPVALTIAGSDSSGGAGIQADLKTFAALGVYGASAITALTAQNTRGVTGIQAVPAEFVTAQIDAVFSDLDVGAVKIGMVAQVPSIDAIAAALSRWKPKHVVLDPVMVATSGDRLLASEAVDALRTRLIPMASVITPNLPEAAALLDEEIALSEAEIESQGRRLLAAEAVEALREKLIPMASVITPNLPEAAALLDEPIATSEAGIESQGQRLLALGCRAVLIKGGHGEGAESTDYLVSVDGSLSLAAPRVATGNTHGTGCSLSSAVAAGLARGEALELAVRNAKAWISAAIAAADRFSVGHGHGPIHHFHRFY